MLVVTGPGVRLQVGVRVHALMWAAGVHILSVAQKPVVCETAVGLGRPTPVELYSRAVQHDVPRYGPDACVLNKSSTVLTFQFLRPKQRNGLKCRLRNEIK